MKKLFVSGFVVLFLSLPSLASSTSVEFIIKFKNRSGAQSSAFSEKLGKGRCRRLNGRRNLIRAKFESSADIQDMLSDPDIEYIEPNYTVFADPEVSAEEAENSVALTQVSESWVLVKDLASGGTKTVAVIDSGMDLTHPLFVKSDSIWENAAEKAGSPGVDDDNNGYVDDLNGWNFISGSGMLEDDSSHGTHVSGIVLSAGQNILTEEVETSKIKIMPLRFLNASGVGTTADAIQAIYYAVDNGAAVINNSWGGSNYSHALKEAYEYANSKGVVIVSAAGNYGRDNDEFAMFPANYSTANNISVMAVYNNDEIAGFSNYGLKSVSLAAPGVSILSAAPGTCAGGCYKRMSGTSMAAPFVAGVAALLRRESPRSSAVHVKEIILTEADPVQGLHGTSVTGARVNVLKAVIRSQVASTEEVGDTPAVSASPKAFNTTGGAGAGCGLVAAAGKFNPADRNLNRVLLFSLLLLPVILAQLLRRSFGISRNRSVRILK